MSHGAQRNRLLKLSVISSLSGKGVSMITQLLALPLAVGALGLDRFGIYAMLTAIFLWANSATAIVGSALSLKIVKAHATQDTELEARLFSTAFLFTLGAAASLALVFQLALRFIDLGHLFGITHPAYLEELQQAAACMAVLLPFNVLFSLSESTQSGYQKQYLTNILLAIANAFVIGALVMVRKHPSVMAMVLAVYLPPTLARLANLVILLRMHPHLWPRWRLVDRRLVAGLVTMGGGFFAMQMGSFAYQQFPIFYVGRHVGLDGAAYFAAMMQVIAISGSFLIIFTQPLLPAISDASIRHDYPWIRTTHRLAVTRLVPYIVLASAAIAVGGSILMSQLLRHPVHLDGATRLAWAAFFLLVAWEHIGYIFLAGIGRLWTATTLYLLGAATMLATLLVLVAPMGVAGAFTAMCLGPLVFTVVAYPKILHANLRHASPQIANQTA